MKRLLTPVCACLTVVAIMVVPAAGAKPSDSSSKVSAADEQYLQTSISGDRFEIIGGKLAEKKSSNTAVLKAAQTIVSDHTKSLSDAIKLAHELQAGRRYSVIVSTGGGLYSYRLNDLIEVVDFYHQCPLVRFAGRQSKVVDICGEKLNEDFVRTTAASLLEKHALHAKFWMMAPEWPPEARPFYTLFIQFDAAAAIDERQLATIHQRSTRRCKRAITTSTAVDWGSLIAVVSSSLRRKATATTPILPCAPG